MGSTSNICFCDAPYETVIDAYVLAIATEWSDFLKLDMKGVKNLMDKPYLFDGRNMFGPEEMRSWGFNMRELGEDNSVEKLPLVSVIIPCRNEEKFIGKCLDSIYYYLGLSKRQIRSFC